MKNKKGMALVEIIIGSAIITTGILAAITSYNTYISYAMSNSKNIQASYILEEGLEVMTFFRDVSWLNISGLSTTTTYHLVFNGTSWATTTTPEYVDGEFLRNIIVSDVQRNGSDQIDSSGVYDPNIKLITTTVEYSQGHATTTKSISTYITNINAN